MIGVPPVPVSDQQRNAAGLRWLRERPPRRIAIIRALHVGDLLLAVPAFRSLRAGFPEAEITLIGLPWAGWFVDRYAAYIDRFVEFAGYPGIIEVEVDPERVAHFLAEQRAYGYDLVIQMHGNGSASNPFALDLHAPATAGCYIGQRPRGLTIARPYPDGAPEILRNLAVSQVLNCPDTGTWLEMPIGPGERERAADLLGVHATTAAPIVGLHPGARPPARRWPAASFAAVGDRLAEAGARIVLTGGPGEEDTVADVAARMAHPALNLAGRTTLGDLAAVIASLDLFVSNDTGPAHIAEAVGTPSVTIFGPADPYRWGPLDQAQHRIVREPVPCSPCPHWECPIDHRCLRRIPPERVVTACDALLMTREATA